eukprot:Hpha_TRINITY_DN33656_c0_g1::TRINITY_DN33656_c0_g1_i1::g.43308::m.43308
MSRMRKTVSLQQMLAEQSEELSLREFQLQVYQTSSPALLAKKKRLPKFPSLPPVLNSSDTTLSPGGIRVDQRDGGCCPLCMSRVDSTAGSMSESSADLHSAADLSSADWRGTPVKAARQTSHQEPAPHAKTDLLGDLNERERRLAERQRVLRALERQLGSRAKMVESMRKDAEERFATAQGLYEDTTKLRAQLMEHEKALSKMREQQLEQEKRLNAQQQSIDRLGQDLDRREKVLTSREANVAERLLNLEESRRVVISGQAAAAEKARQMSSEQEDKAVIMRDREAACEEQERKLKVARFRLAEEREAMQEEWRKKGTHRVTSDECAARGYPVLGMVAEIVAADASDEESATADAVETLRKVGCYGLSVLVQLAATNGSNTRQATTELADAGLQSLADCVSAAAVLPPFEDKPVDALEALLMCTCAEDPDDTDKLRMLFEVATNPVV